MPIRGKLVVFVLFLVSIAAGVFSVWYNHHMTHRALEMFGPDSVWLIVHGPHVELLELSDSRHDDLVGGGNDLSVDDLAKHVARRLDVSTSSGLIHARNALRQDASYNWNPPQSNCEPDWQYALRFTDDEKVTTLLFDFKSRLIQVPGRRLKISMSVKFSSGLESYFEEQFEGWPQRTDLQPKNE